MKFYTVLAHVAAMWGASNALDTYSESGDIEQVIVIPDVHGDTDLLLFSLANMGIINIEDSGSIKTVSDLLNVAKYQKLTSASERRIIQLGDIADRGPKSIDAYRVMKWLRESAEEVGDSVIQLLGNHELFLLCGQYSYFNPQEMKSEYGGDASGLTVDLSPSGWLGKEIRDNYRIGYEIDDTVLIHAGLELDFCSADFEDLRKQFWKHVDEDRCSTSIPNTASAVTGPLWTRKVSNAFFGERKVMSPNGVIEAHGVQPLEACEIIKSTLQCRGKEKLIVGHTPTETAEPELHCEGRYLMHDTGFSRWMGGPFSPRISVFKPGDKKAKFSQWDHSVFIISPGGDKGDAVIQLQPYSDIVDVVKAKKEKAALESSDESENKVDEL